MRTSHLWLCVGVAMIFFACDRNTTYVEEVTGPAGCNDCHDSGDKITAKRTQWLESRHATGDSYLRATSRSCAFCHSGDAFADAVAAGLAPNQLTQGDPDPTHQDCRACHMIHETYTAQDWALRTTSAVPFYAIAGSTFDGGNGNLCARCHQPRLDFPVAVNDSIADISDHWGPHHSPQSSMILGVGGAGVTGTAHQHYGIDNTCVNCHLGDADNHAFEPVLASCRVQACHPTATNFNINGRQAEIIGLADQLGEMLVTAGLLSENSIDGHPIVEKAEEDQAIALWNWLYVHHEDKSNGVHNYPYTKAMLEEGIIRMGGTPIVASSSR